MQKEIRRVADRENDTLCITTDDERFYGREIPDPQSGVPKRVWVPSITFICSQVPADKYLSEYREKLGTDAADAYMRLRGDRGTKIHDGSTMLLNGESIDCERTLFHNRSTDQMEALRADEIECLMAFADWHECAISGKTHDAAKRRILPSGYEILEWNELLWDKQNRFAGTLDIRARRLSDGKVGVIDEKNTKAIYKSHRAQVCGYRRADPTLEWGAILRLGGGNKRGWFFEEVPDDKFRVFDAAYENWLDEYGDDEFTFQRDYPLTISLTNPPLKEKEGERK
jgi:hypothetical protein